MAVPKRKLQFATHAVLKLAPQAKVKSHALLGFLCYCRRLMVRGIYIHIYNITRNRCPIDANFHKHTGIRSKYTFSRLDMENNSATRTIETLSVQFNKVWLQTWSAPFAQFTNLLCVLILFAIENEVTTWSFQLLNFANHQKKE